MSMAKAIIPWIGVLTALFLAAFALPEAIEGLSASSEVSTWVSTRAEVERQLEREHKVGPDTAIVEYSFRVGKRKYRGSNHLTVWSDDEEAIEDRIRREPDGTRTLLVWYDPQHPKSSVIRRDIPRLPHILWIVVTTIVAIISAGAVIRARRRKRFLAAARRGHSRPSSSSSSGTGSDGGTSSDGEAS